jgi:hypothetical protein
MCSQIGYSQKQRMKTFELGNATISREQFTVKRFDQGYLFVSGLLLAFTGLGKVPTDFVVMRCIEEPMLGIYQPHGVTNMGLSGFAAGIELAIVALICMSPVRWLPCLASCIWGTLCLALHLLMFKDGFQHCNCLGWVDAPPVTAEIIAGWLSIAGTIAFWQSWRNPEQAAHATTESRNTIRISRRLPLWSVAVACVVWGVITLLTGANYDEYKMIYGPLFLAVAPL